nr:MAG TPA: hypothetical protein [Bacteriophage sp.]
MAPPIFFCLCGHFTGSDAHPPVFTRTVKIKTF